MSVSAPVTTSSIQEYSIRVPKNVKKRYHVMRFNATLGVEFNKWTSVKMERENNMKEFRGIEEDTPRFGAGSEFGKEAREEARRKKLGIISRKYKPDDQPWILKAGGSLGKKFKGIREGGVSENASYYVFTHAPDGAIEAFPLNEWYKFQPIQRYKALSAEEAEQEFGKRNKVLNYFSLMLRKRLKGDEEIETEEGEEVKGKKGAAKKTKDLKISDMDEWMESSEDDSSNEEEEKKDKDEEEKQEKKKKGKKADAKKKSKPKRDTDLEAFEDSDDGDNEGRELDYISDSSESEPENSPSKDLQGVSEEKALRKLLTSDEDSEDDENKSEKEQSHEDEEEKEEKKEEKETEKKKSKKKQKKKEDNSKKKKKEKDKGKSETKTETKESSSDFSSDSSDSETEKKKVAVKKEEEKESNSANSSRSASPMPGSSQGSKRKLPAISEAVVKKPKFDTSLSNYIPGSNESGITEDAVRRYLMRKPMTTTELLQKFKSKKTRLSNDQLVNIMTHILKKINPIKQTVKDKMYLSIKA